MTAVLQGVAFRPDQTYVSGALPVSRIWNAYLGFEKQIAQCATAFDPETLRRVFVDRIEAVIIL